MPNGTVASSAMTLVALLSFAIFLGALTVAAVGTVAWYVTGSITVGVVWGLISLLPFFWVYKARMRDDQELRDYYSSQK